jgi:hypothetical protein
MQGRDGEPPEVVRVCGHTGGEDNVLAGGCNDGGRCRLWEEEEKQKREKGWKEKRERVAVATWWLCWLLVVELVFRVGMVVDEGHSGERGRGKRGKLQKPGNGWFFG